MTTAWQIIPDRFADGRHIAFEEGARAVGYTVEDGRRIKNIQPRPGDILLTWNLHGYKEPIAEQFEAAGGHVMVCEEGYTRRFHGVPHFAVSLHGHNGSGCWFPKGPDRWRALGIDLEPWRLDGDHILVCGQRGIGTKAMASPPDWEHRAADRLRKITSRRIVVRSHPGRRKGDPDPPFVEQMKGAWAVAVWSSACACEALRAGIPAFVDAPHHILDGAVLRGLERIDRPTLTNRQDAFSRMAWAQWSLDEIRAGLPFRHLFSEMARAA